VWFADDYFDQRCQATLALLAYLATACPGFGGSTMSNETPGAESRLLDKAALLERIRSARSDLEQALGRLSDEQLVAPGADGWSAKDHLAHLIVWEQGLVALLEHRPRYIDMGLDEATYLSGDTDRLNTIFYQRSKDRPLPEVLDEFRRSHQHVLDVLARLSEDDLYRTYSHYQPDEPGEDSGAPILGWIAGNTYEHYAEHQGWIEALARVTR
jgi:hypothetical protein